MRGCTHVLWVSWEGAGPGRPLPASSSLANRRAAGLMSSKHAIVVPTQGPAPLPTVRVVFLPLPLSPSLSLAHADYFRGHIFLSRFFGDTSPSPLSVLKSPLMFCTETYLECIVGYVPFLPAVSNVFLRGGGYTWWYKNVWNCTIPSPVSPPKATSNVCPSVTWRSE